MVSRHSESCTKNPDKWSVMAKLWTANNQASSDFDLLDIPPSCCSSVCVGQHCPIDPDALFTDEYWDLLFSPSDQAIEERLRVLKSWSETDGWIARRDTPQCRWLNRLFELRMHLGQSIIELINQKGITVNEH